MTKSGTVQAIAHRHKHQINAIAFSPDGSQFATASSDRTIRIWDAKALKEIGVLRGNQSRVESLSWSPDGQRIIGGSDTIRIWNAISHKEIGVFGEDLVFKFAIRLTEPGLQPA